jgi:hypothetical protein
MSGQGEGLRLEPRSVQDGGFTVARLEGHCRGDVYGQRYPAVHLLQGGFGYRYYSADRSVPRANLVRAATPREFVAHCQAEYGVLFLGVGVGAEGVFSVDAS